MKRPILTAIFAAATAVVVGAAAIDAGSGSSEGTARSSLTIMAPAAPGGGWDTFAREAQQAMRLNGVVNNVQVVNVPGAGGTIGLSQFAGMTGREDIIMVTGAVMIGGTVVSRTPDTVAEMTPLARMADDYNALVVPADSPYDTLEEFVEAWQEDPGGHAIAGGSLGSIDHLLSGLLGEAVGIEPTDVNYVAYSGGGEVLSSLLSNTAAAGISGYTDFRDQIEAGTLKALGVSAAEPVDGVDVPTFIESGVDVEMSNWRGFVGAPGITDEQRDELVAILEDLSVTADWEDAVMRNNWDDSFSTGDEYVDFIDEETARIEGIVRELGL